MGRAPEQADALRRFAKWHIISGDIDPVYPVLQNLGTLYCADEEEAIRLTFLYVTYYNLPSAIAAWNQSVFTKPGRLPELPIAKYPTGTERRAHRMPNKLIEHLAYLDGLVANYGSLHTWLTHDLTSNAETNWLIVQDKLRSVRHNGRWAAYKTGEILATVHGWPLSPTDAGHDFSSGPRQGLADCFPEAAQIVGYKPEPVRKLDQLTHDLGVWLSDGLGIDVPVEQVETVLCDWHSVQKGHYYVGHDIDLLLEQTHKAGEAQRLKPQNYREMFWARDRSFDRRWLGEHNGWDGVRKPLKRAYIDEGIIEWWS